MLDRNRTKAPETVEELVSAVNALHAEAVDLIQAFFAARATESAQKEISLPTDGDEPPGQISPLKPYQPRTALYRLAFDTMSAFWAERHRLPGERELLDAMPAHDSDYIPVSPRLDKERRVIHWRDDGVKKKTSLDSFRNALVHIRRAVTVQSR